MFFIKPWAKSITSKFIIKTRNHTHSKRVAECRLDIVGDAEQQGLTTRDQRHTGSHEANHVMRRSTHARLLGVKGKVLWKQTKCMDL